MDTDAGIESIAANFRYNHIGPFYSGLFIVRYIYNRYLYPLYNGLYPLVAAISTPYPNFVFRGG
jgi:hypothetical protein